MDADDFFASAVSHKMPAHLADDVVAPMLALPSVPGPKTTASAESANSCDWFRPLLASNHSSSGLGDGEGEECEETANAVGVWEIDQSRT